MTIVAGTFAAIGEAEHAKSELMAAGIAEACIVVSRPLTEDAIGAEAAGQSYENQDYASSDQRSLAPGWTDTDWARFNTELRSAGCVVSARSNSKAQEARIAGILQAAGARSVVARPSGHG